MSGCADNENDVNNALHPTKSTALDAKTVTLRYEPFMN